MDERTICQWLDEEFKGFDEHNTYLNEYEVECKFTKEDYVHAFAERVIALIHAKGFQLKNANKFKEYLCEFIYVYSYDG
jgi:hypothetical protein